jgi:hypothetical protein
VATTALPTIPIVRHTTTPPPPPPATKGELLVVVTPWADVSLNTPGKTARVEVDLSQDAVRRQQ